MHPAPTFNGYQFKIFFLVLSFQFFQKRDRSLASSATYSCYIYQDDLTFKSLNDTGRSFISFNVHSDAFLPVRLAAIFLEGTP